VTLNFSDSDHELILRESVENWSSVLIWRESVKKSAFFDFGLGNCGESEIWANPGMAQKRKKKRLITGKDFTGGRSEKAKNAANLERLN
jgi:hypothetical protein